MLSEIRQPQKDWYNRTHEVSKAVKTTETESRKVVTKAGGQGRWENSCSVDTEFQFCTMKKF